MFDIIFMIMANQINLILDITFRMGILKFQNSK